MAKYSFFSFVREQWTALPIPNVDVGDKSVVITGANVGLGFEAAARLASLKPRRLVLTARDETKCKQAKQDPNYGLLVPLVPLQQSVINNIEAWPLELSSFDSVRKFADRVESEGLPINAFVANAAVATKDYAKTKDGWETTLQVNYLSTVLLSILMLPHLIKSSTPSNASRLVIVTSSVHFNATLDSPANGSSILEHLNDEETCMGTAAMVNRYPVSKLLEIMFVRELASRLPNPTPVSVSAVNPGLCHSQLARSIEKDLVSGTMMRIRKALLARSTEMGSRTLSHPAVEPGERERHGRYVSACEVAEESDFVLSEEGNEISRRLWTETIQILEKIDPRVNRIISEHLLAL